MDPLTQLEKKSVYILREAHSAFKSLCMLWSIGKDSTVMLWLARKAFFGHVPFPLVHIDTSFKIPEMIAYRDRLAGEWDLDIIYGQNESALAARQTFPDGATDRIACCAALKTEALKQTLSGKGKRYRYNHAARRYEVESNPEPFTGVIVGARADEEGSRSKERYFSPRDYHSAWNVDDQPPEFWNHFNLDFVPGTHLRIHPLLDWTELNIWEYIRRESIPTVSLYGVPPVYRADRVRRPHRRRDHRRAAKRKAQKCARAVGAGPGPGRWRLGDAEKGRLHVSDVQAGLEPAPVAQIREKLNVVIVGHVDHGKSTIVGR